LSQLYPPSFPSSRPALLALLDHPSPYTSPERTISARCFYSLNPTAGCPRDRSEWRSCLYLAFPSPRRYSKNQSRGTQFLSFCEALRMEHELSILFFSQARGDSVREPSAFPRFPSVLPPMFYTISLPPPTGSKSLPFTEPPFMGEILFLSKGLSSSFPFLPSSTVTP